MAAANGAAAGEAFGGVLSEPPRAMADPLAPTVPTPPGDDAPGEATPTTAVGHMVRAAPVADPLERAVALVGRRSVAAPPPCQGGEASIAGAWGGTRRTAANTFLTGLAGDYARESVPRIVAALDRYADDWVIIQRASCMAHQRGEVSSAAFDRRTACLARRKAALTAVASAALPLVAIANVARAKASTASGSSPRSRPSAVAWVKSALPKSPWPIVSAIRPRASNARATSGW